MSKKLKKFLLVLVCIVCTAALLTIAASIASYATAKKNFEFAQSVEKLDYTNQLVPEKDADGNWCFTTDKEFKIVQITDVHIGAGFLSVSKDAEALKSVEIMLREEKPDLVIVTGDIAFPVPYAAGTINNKNSANMFAQMMDNLGIYWTLCFGNHDTELYSLYSRKDISDFYTSGAFKYCLFHAGPDDVDGYGNQIIKINNTKGEPVQTLYIFDSHSYADGDFFGILWKYDKIHDNQIEWYRQNVEKIKAENGGKNVNSLAFFHIPLTEYKDAWEEFAANGYKDTENVKYLGGIIGEKGKAIYCSNHTNNLFDTMLELGSTKAIFCGHDHFNNMAVNYKGIVLSYGYSIDCLAYSNINNQGSQRGCTVINVLPDAAFNFEKYNLYTSGRYTLPEGFADDIEMEFEGVTYQYFEEK